MAARLRSRKYSLMKGVKLSRLVNKNQLQLVIHLLSQSFKSNLVPRQLFTSVFGVGPKTAEKWYRRGLRSFSDVLAQPGIHLNRMQQSGTSKIFPPSSENHFANYRSGNSIQACFQKTLSSLIVKFPQ